MRIGLRSAQLSAQLWWKLRAQDYVSIIDRAMRREHSAEYGVALGLADLVTDQVGQKRQDLVTDQVDMRYDNLSTTQVQWLKARCL